MQELSRYMGCKRKTYYGCLRLFPFYLMLTTAAAPASETNSSSYWLHSPESYTILSNDIKVSYKISSTTQVLRIQLVEMTETKERLLAKVDIPKNSDSGTAMFPCGLLVKAGKVAFRLVTIKEEKVLARTHSIDVLWPSVSVHVPLVVETYSSDVIVQLDIQSADCKLLKDKNYMTYAELVYEGPILSSSGKGTSLWQEPTTIVSKELKKWLLEPAYDVTLNCEYFDKAGYYKVRIRTTVGHDPIVAESDTIHVIWSHRYSVSVAKPAVEPCNDNLKIIYHYPRCASDRDRLRVYGKKRRGVAKPPKYIFESKVQSGRHFTKLSCEIFGEELAEYCFSFVSTAKSGAVFELDTQCIPRIAAHADDLSPTWREWGEWSECSASCGSGVHSRYRLCTPTKSIQSCEGKSVQTELCNKQDCPEIRTVISEKYLDLPLECYCGCTMNVTERILVNVSLSSCMQPSVWVLQSWPSGLLTITVRRLSFLSVENILIVRDGVSSLGSILAIFSNINGSQEIHSSSEFVRLEVQCPNGSSLEGSFMTLLIERSEISRESMAMIQSVSRPNAYSLSTVHVTMIMLTIVLCIAAILQITILYIRNVKQTQNPSDSSSSMSSLSQEHKGHNTQHPTASTSTSELSDSSLLHRRSPKYKVSTPANSPEDYLHNSFLFKSANSVYTVSPSSTGTPPSRNKLVSLKTEIPNSPTISWQLKSGETIEADIPRKPLKSALKHKPTPSNKINLSCSDSSSPVRRRGKPLGRGIKQTQRDSTTPLTASVSELSMTGSEDGFEYDYYDYGCHEVPGSFFCQDPILIGWPPFIPIPPEGSDEASDFPLQHFVPSPKHSEDDIQSTKSANP